MASTTVPEPSPAADVATLPTPTAAPAAAATSTTPAAGPTNVVPAVSSPPPAESGLVESATSPSTSTAGQIADPIAESTTAGPAPGLPSTEPADPKTDSPAGATGTATWPEVPADHPLGRLRAELDSILAATEYNEVYGLYLTSDPAGAFHTNLILQKFLRANSDDVAKARNQLERTLQWRKVARPLDLIDQTYSAGRFGGLGYVTKLSNGTAEQIVAFNVYGAVKDKKNTFGNSEGFIQWRIALMEKTLQLLHLDKATEPIPDFSSGLEDPYRVVQVHDYATLSILRQDPHVRAASKKTIDIMVNYYPETLSRKFFVNISAAAVLLYRAMTYVLPKATTNKFILCSSGTDLASHLADFKAGLPAEYGGDRTEPLAEIGDQLKLASEPEAEAESEPTKTVEKSEPEPAAETSTAGADVVATRTEEAGPKGSEPELEPKSDGVQAPISSVDRSDEPVSLDALKLEESQTASPAAPQPGGEPKASVTPAP